MTHGFLLGKFLPPHDGHVLLCEVAQARVDVLTILVCSLPNDPVPGALRAEWMRALFPRARVIHHDAIVPQAPEDNPDFWQIWRDIVKAAHPEPIDYVFASEGYGAQLARQVGAVFHPVDPERVMVPISGTSARSDPYGNWRFLPGPVRAHYARTISLHGPESVGKSVLGVQLASALGAKLAPEFGRTWCEAHGTDCTMDDLLAIAQTQQAMIEAAKPRSNGWVVTDTDALMTAVWADMMLGARDPWFDRFDQTADLYLLLDIDLPFHDDGLRLYGGEEERRRFFDLCREELERRGVRWALVSGMGDARLENALKAIRDVLGDVT